MTTATVNEAEIEGCIRILESLQIEGKQSNAEALRNLLNEYRRLKEENDEMPPPQIHQRDYESH